MWYAKVWPHFPVYHVSPLTGMEALWQWRFYNFIFSWPQLQHGEHVTDTWQRCDEWMDGWSLSILWPYSRFCRQLPGLPGVPFKLNILRLRSLPLQVTLPGKCSDLFLFEQDARSRQFAPDVIGTTVWNKYLTIILRSLGFMSKKGRKNTWSPLTFYDFQLGNV